MMPGMGQMKDQLAELDDSHFDRVTAIIRSMTPGERTNPKIINGSRRVRIANGSGVTVMDVNQLLNRFTDAQKMMKQMGGMMGLPGGGRRKATKSPKNKRKGTKGGNRPRGVGVPAGCRAASRVACRSCRRAWTRTPWRRAGPAAGLQAPEARLQQARQPEEATTTSRPAAETGDSRAGALAGLGAPRPNVRSCSADSSALVPSWRPSSPWPLPRHPPTALPPRITWPRRLPRRRLPARPGHRPRPGLRRPGASRPGPRPEAAEPRLRRRHHHDPAVRRRPLRLRHGVVPAGRRRALPAPQPAPDPRGHHRHRRQRRQPLRRPPARSTRPARSPPLGTCPPTWAGS